MDQTNSLAAALLNSSSLLSGILSQMSAVYGAYPAPNSLFSNLVSESTVAQNVSEGSTPKTTEVTSVPADSTLTTSSSSQSSASLSTPQAPSDTSAPQSSFSSQDTQNASSLTEALHKALAFLRQENNQDASSKNRHVTSGTQSSASQVVAQHTTSATTVSTAVSSDAATTTTTPADTLQSTDLTAASDIKKSLSEIIAELLALLQLITQKAPQTQTATSGGTNVAAVPATTVESNGAAPITDATVTVASEDLSAAAATSTSTSTSILTSTNASEDLTASAVATVPTSADPILTLSDVNVSATVEPLIQLLKTVEEGVQKLLAADTQISQAAGSPALETAPLTTETPTVSNGASQLIQFDAAIKNILAALQTQASDSQAPKNTPNVALTVAAPATVITPTRGLGASDTSNKNAALNDSSNLSAASITVAPTTTSTASTTSPTFSPALAATTADASNNGDSHSGSDWLSNGEHASPFANASINTNSSPGLTAEGAQAAGTYNFASTLSAFRAANGGTTGLPSVIDQVVLQMNHSVKSGQSQMSVQLQPGDLGKITVKLDIGTDGKVQGTVTADNPKTLDMLQKDSRSLERALQDAGLRADQGSLQFGLSKQGNQNSAGQAANSDGNNSGNAMGDGTTTASDHADAELVDIGAIAETYYITPTGVNISV